MPLDSAIQLESVEPKPVEGLDGTDREALFSDRPWLVVVHNALVTAKDAHELQEDLAQRLGVVDDSPYLYPQPWSKGMYWHNDGKDSRPLVNIHSTFGRVGGVMYMATAPMALDLSPKYSESEEHILSAIPELLKASKIRQPISRVPFDSTISFLWREVDPKSGITDTAHAVYAEPGRRSVVSEHTL